MASGSEPAGSDQTPPISNLSEAKAEEKGEGNEDKAMKAAVSFHGTINSPTAVQRLGDEPAAPKQVVRQLTRSKTAASFNKTLKSGRMDDTETEEEYQQVRRKSLALRQACQHDIVKATDMKPAMRDLAIDEATMAIVRAAARQGWDNEIAARLKKRMEKKSGSISGGHWHCIVGPDFGSYVTNEKGCFIYMYLPRFLAPVERIEHQRELRQIASGAGSKEPEVQEATGDIEDPALRAMLKTDPERPALDTARTGPLIGVGPTAQRMIGILLWRT